jgi:hypothetical protein
MSDKVRNIPRSKMTAPERQLRSQLAQLVNQQGLMRGSLSVRQRACGKAGCKCTRGQLHESLYLVLSEEGRMRQLYVPRAFEARVRQWVENHRRARRLMEEISRRYWKKVRDRQE